MVIANYLAANIVDEVFGAPEQHSSLEILIAIYAYAVQIYADFSGYTDIAIGLALLLGFAFPQNFDSPYAATSVQDFWRRWHMSLSRWLRDYLYIPLGGNRGRPGCHVPQPDAHDAARRALARRRLDVRRLGRAARRRARRRPLAPARGPATSRPPRHAAGSGARGSSPSTSSASPGSSSAPTRSATAWEMITRALHAAGARRRRS